MTAPQWVIPGESIFDAVREEHARRQGGGAAPAPTTAGFALRAERVTRLDRLAVEIEDADEGVVEARDPHEATRHRHRGLEARRMRVRLLLEDIDQSSAPRLAACVDRIAEDLGPAALDDLAEQLGGGAMTVAAVAYEAVLGLALGVLLAVQAHAARGDTRKGRK